MKAIPFIFILIFLCCSTTGGNSGSDAHDSVRYVNLRIIVDAIVAEDPEWKVLTSRIIDLRRKRKHTEVSSADSNAGIKKVNEDELSVLEKKETEIKRRIYPLIERAIKAVARRGEVTLVINSNDVLYSDDRADITGEVLSETRSIKMRDDPLSR